MRQDPNNYWEQLERLEKLIRASELKAGIIFSFHSLIIGLFIDRIGQFQPVIQSSKVFVVLAVLWMICVLISIFYCFKCFMSQICSNPSLHLKKKYRTVIFRGWIVKSTLNLHLF